MRRSGGFGRLQGFALAVLFAGGACIGASNEQARPSASPSASMPTLALVHGRLIDGTGAAPVPDATVLIAGEAIVAAGPASDVTVPAGVDTIELSGATILPGFINAHVHRGLDESNLRAWAEGGVTTVRDESTSPGQIAGLSAFRAGASADRHLARLISAGAMLKSAGGYGERAVGSPEDAAAAVEDEVARGVDAIKVAIEDGYAGVTGLPKLTTEELTAIVGTAHAHRLPVSGHITQGRYLEAILDAGVDDVAHLPYDAIPPDALRALVDRGVYLTPTFSVYRAFGVSPDGLVANLRRIVDAGGRIALGSDYGGGPGEFELGIPMYEIEMMAKAGMTPMQIVEASTRNAAHVIRRDADLGTIEPAKAADILVVAGDPLEDLQALRSVRLVIHAGVVITDRLGPMDAGSGA